MSITRTKELTAIVNYLHTIPSGDAKTYAKTLENLLEQDIAPTLSSFKAYATAKKPQPKDYAITVKDRNKIVNNLTACREFFEGDLRNAANVLAKAKWRKRVIGKIINENPNADVYGYTPIQQKIIRYGIYCGQISYFLDLLDECKEDSKLLAIDITKKQDITKKLNILSTFFEKEIFIFLEDAKDAAKSSEIPIDLKYIGITDPVAGARYNVGANTTRIKECLSILNALSFCPGEKERDIKPPKPAPSPKPQPSPSPSPKPQPSPSPSPKPQPQPSPSPLPQPSPLPSPQPSEDTETDTSCDEILEGLRNLKIDPCDLTEVLDNQDDILSWLEHIAVMLDDSRTEQQQNARRSDNMVREILSMLRAKDEEEDDTKNKIRDIHDKLDKWFLIILIAIAIVGALVGLVIAEVLSGFAAVLAAIAPLAAAIGTIAAGIATLTGALTVMKVTLGQLSLRLSFLSNKVGDIDKNVDLIKKIVNVNFNGFIVSDNWVKTVGIPNASPKSSPKSSPSPTTSTNRRTTQRQTFVETPYPLGYNRTVTRDIEAKKTDLLGKRINFGGQGLQGIVMLLLAISHQIRDAQGDLGAGGREFELEVDKEEKKTDLTEIDVFDCVYNEDTKKIDDKRKKLTVPKAQKDRDTYHFKMLYDIKRLQFEILLKDDTVCFPDWWQFRVESYVPQMILVFAREDDEKPDKIDRTDLRQIPIPYPGANTPYSQAPLTHVEKGSYECYVKYSNGTGFRLYLKDEPEAIRVLKVLLPLVKQGKPLQVKTSQMLDVSKLGMTTTFSFEAGVLSEAERKPPKEISKPGKFNLYYIEYSEGIADMSLRSDGKIGNGSKAELNAKKKRNYFKPFYRFPKGMRASNISLYGKNINPFTF